MSKCVLKKHFCVVFTRNQQKIQDRATAVAFINIIRGGGGLQMYRVRYLSQRDLGMGNQAQQVDHRSNGLTMK